MKFWKYSGAGNDFILFEAKNKSFFPAQLLSKLCDRRFGIGADGVLFIDTDHSENDFSMNYINADGGEVEMCGNGARSCVHWFASQSPKKVVEFSTQSGNRYKGRLPSDDLAEVTMNELSEACIINIKDFYDVEESAYLNTGVPHSIFLLKDEQDINSPEWMAKAPSVRNDSRFKNGCNVNFVKVLSDRVVQIRTFERGVEAETMACGTGTVAAARLLKEKYGWHKILFEALGGKLEVRFEAEDCWLAGPVKQVFTGDLKLDTWK